MPSSDWRKISAQSSTSLADRFFARDETRLNGLLCTLVRQMFLTIIMSTGAGVAYSSATPSHNKYSFDIPAQRADLALIAFAEQTDRTLVFSFDEAQAKTANRLFGQFDIVEALELLLAGTGLSISMGDGGQLKVAEDVALNEESIVNKPKTMLGRLGAALTALFVGVGASAEESPRRASENVIEEIVVTALKRSTGATQIDTPLAVSAIAGAELEKQGVTSVFDAMALNPSVSVADVGGQGAGISVRGVGGAVGDSPVGYYIDDLPFTRIGQSVSADLNPYDLNRIEVLRGPQGTLFGLGSAGGAVRVITHDPILDRFEAKASLAWSETSGGGDNQKISAAINVPIMEGTLALRLAGTDIDYGGFIDRPLESNEEFNDDDDSSYRAKLLWQPSENVEVMLSAWHFENTTYNAFANDDYERNVLIFRTNPLTFQPDFTDPIPSKGNEWAVSENETDLYGLRIVWEADSFVLTSSTSYLENESSQVYDDFVVGIIPFTSGVETLAHEVTLASTGTGSLEWVLGAFYADMETRNDQYFGFIFSGSTDATVIPTQDNLNQSEQWAVFGEITYDLNDDWSLTVGGRYVTDDRRTKSLVTGESASDEFSKFTGRLNLAWSPSENALYYVNYAQAYRSGGFNSAVNVARGVANGVPLQRNVDPDEVTSFEVGGKFSLFDGNLDLEVTGYFYDWDDNQVFIQYVDCCVQPGTIAVGNLNAATSEGKGIEISLNYRGVENLQLSIAGNFADTEYTDDVPGAGITDGDAFFQAADTTMFALASYRWSLTDALDLSVAGTVRHISEREDRSTGGMYKSDKTTIFNARVGVEAEKWSLFLTGENIADEDGAVSQFAAFIIAGGEPIRTRPRTIGLELNLHF